MRRQRSIHGSGAGARAGQDGLSNRLLVRSNKLLFSLITAVLLSGWVGCSSRGPEAATSDPVAKVRLTRINKFYRLYTTQKKKPPPDEKSFKDFVRSLPQEEKDAALIRGDDVDPLFVSPRDGQKYHIEYGLVVRPEGQNRALAWE